MSNAQGVAALSFGLIIIGGGGSFPIPYDVRFGVDNGAGELGTLTSPIPANVRAGILYGGDGTQYLGTLYVQSASGGITWTDEMRSLWEDEVADSEFGVTASYGASTFRCIKTPVKSGFAMTLPAFDKQADTIIDMLRSDAIANGLYALVQKDPNTKRPVIIIEGASYTVGRLENDALTNPVIRLSCSQLQ